VTDESEPEELTAAGIVRNHPADRVNITRNGNCYHRFLTCRTIVRRRGVMTISIDDIGDRRPCQVCYQLVYDGTQSFNSLTTSSGTPSVDPNNHSTQGKGRGGRITGRRQLSRREGVSRGSMSSSSSGYNPRAHVDYLGRAPPVEPTDDTTAAINARLDESYHAGFNHAMASPGKMFFDNNPSPAAVDFLIGAIQPQPPVHGEVQSRLNSPGRRHGRTSARDYTPMSRALHELRLM
jgi:hypothetical protein